MSTQPLAAQTLHLHSSQAKATALTKGNDYVTLRKLGHDLAVAGCARCDLHLGELQLTGRLVHQQRRRLLVRQGPERQWLRDDNIQYML